jgi:transposase InsO family protein
MVGCLVESGWSVEATAERFQVDAKTVRKWRDRFEAEGEAGLLDRSSRPHRSPARTAMPRHRLVVELRAQRRWGADRIGHEVGLAPSTVQRILNLEGVGRLDRGDRATAAVIRYQRDRPGELVHVDVKKLPAIPEGGGWRVRGKGRANGMGARSPGVGYRYLHSALDDRSRFVYSEILDDEQGATAAAFWHRAVAAFAQLGVAVEEVLTDNGACYRSRAWAAACAQHATVHRRTRPYRPQTNGKVERYHRTLLEEWAYIRPWASETDREAGYAGFTHFYNRHRPHGALRWATPSSILGDNLPEEHI